MSVNEILNELRKERWMKEWVIEKMALGVTAEEGTRNSLITNLLV